MFKGAARRFLQASKSQLKPKRKIRWILPAAIALPVLYIGLQDRQPNQPWTVTAYGALPLKALSRVWGKFNDITLPVWLRVPGFTLYSWVFGVNLDEMKDKDLKNYRNLSEFFYRELAPGARAISDAELVSPSDGKVLQFGQLVGDRIEEVKGMSYSLDAFLGAKSAPEPKTVPGEELTEDELGRHQEFARINGISYTVDDIMGNEKTDTDAKQVGDAADDKANPQADLKALVPDWQTLSQSKDLFYCVIYLAPGDYHRFHSPTSWVVQLRRHFVGELFSVAPFIQSRVYDLFCLNERVALLGKWKYGFFSMTPVGATNVGSITINFDKFLKTNTKYIEDEGKKVRTRRNTCYEATYSSASPLLRGFPLTKGNEIGGFHLGSTVVLVFEAPESFTFTLKKGQQIKMGEALGRVASS